MRTTRVQPMVEGGILSAVAILFALISVYVPFIGVFVNLIWPVPIILLGVRHGYKWSLMATVVAGILIGQVTELWTSHSYKPTQNIAHQGEYGSATVILEGISVGMLSTAAPVVSQSLRSSPIL